MITHLLSPKTIFSLTPTFDSKRIPDTLTLDKCTSSGFAGAFAAGWGKGASDGSISETDGSEVENTCEYVNMYF